jgi:hypothetical protein
MSGRRPLIKGYFAALRLIVGAVMSSALIRVVTPVGPDVVRRSLAPITLSRLTAQSMPRALGSNRALRITSWSPSILVQPLATDDVGGRYAGSAL